MMYANIIFSIKIYYIMWDYSTYSDIIRGAMFIVMSSWNRSLHA
jgi:hypothetical protein